MSKGKMVSPNDLHNAAKQTYLNGRDPVNDTEWQLCINFWAANIAVAEVECSQIMARIYQCPLSQDDVKVIAEFQQSKKAKQHE